MVRGHLSLPTPLKELTVLPNTVQGETHQPATTGPGPEISVPSPGLGRPALDASREAKTREGPRGQDAVRSRGTSQKGEGGSSRSPRLGPGTAWRGDRPPTGCTGYTTATPLSQTASRASVPCVRTQTDPILYNDSLASSALIRSRRVDFPSLAPRLMEGIHHPR